MALEFVGTAAESDVRLPAGEYAVEKLAKDEAAVTLQPYGADGRALIEGPATIRMPCGAVTEFPRGEHVQNVPALPGEQPTVTECACVCGEHLLLRVEPLSEA